MSSEFTHLDPTGSAAMVDVGDKLETDRMARASGRIEMSAATALAVAQCQLHKGDVLPVARIAGIQAAKRTADLIPLCHTLRLSRVAVEFELEAEAVVARAEVRAHDRTGAEMEALTATTVALLTIYDMCKSLDKRMTIGQVRLEQKTGGKAGSWSRDDQDPPIVPSEKAR